MSTATEAANSGTAAPVRCQRIGCDAMFTDDNNSEGSCKYHPSVSTAYPFFHLLPEPQRKSPSTASILKST
jgi:disease resistance protein